MNKDDLMKIKKYSDFENALIRMGYKECTKKSGSHRKFEQQGKPPLSIPCHNRGKDIAVGTKRNIVKLIFA